MKIGIISDSHDQRERILEAIAFFNREHVELVVHCGDWVSPFSAARFSALKCPIKGVFGNNDGDKAMHRERNKFVEYFDDALEAEIGGRKIFVAHGHKPKAVEEAVKSGKYDAVFSGHTHVAHVKKEGKTLWINPGTLVDETTSKIKGMSIALYETETNEGKLVLF
jgi:uncharacterized protein